MSCLLFKASLLRPDAGSPWTTLGRADNDLPLQGWYVNVTQVRVYDVTGPGPVGLLSVSGNQAGYLMRHAQALVPLCYRRASSLKTATCRGSPNFYRALTFACRRASVVVRCSPS